MSYISLSFTVFVAFFFLIYRILPSRISPYVLLVASVLFYLNYDFRFFYFLLFVGISTFLFAKFTSKNATRNMSPLIICILINFAVWFLTKELPWAYSTLGRIFSFFGAVLPEFPFTPIVPIGISYYILQAFSYIIDVYKGKIAPEKNLFKFLLYLSFFPAIVQGPISRYDELAPQLNRKSKFDFILFRASLIRILIGLIKKMVIADHLAPFVNYCFTETRYLQGAILYVGAIFYSIQLYTDFSGCVDICRGIGGLFGIDLPENFDRPYFSRSIKEFWSKWHISLSRWLKDYIYIPLGGNRKGTFNKFVFITCTFLISGLWHGAGFNFLIWGLMHAFFQIIGELTKNMRRKFKNLIGVRVNSFSEKLYSTLFTFHLVTLGWIFFRAEGLLEGLRYLKNMFDGADLWTLVDGSLFTHGISKEFYPIIIFHILLILIVEFICKNKERLVLAIGNAHIFIRWTILLLLVFDVLVFGAYGSGYSLRNFLYGGF